MMIATLGSTPMEKANVPIPRRMTELLMELALCEIVSEGTARDVGKFDQPLIGDFLRTDRGD